MWEKVIKLTSYILHNINFIRGIIMYLTKKQLLARTKVWLDLKGLTTMKKVKLRVEELNPVVGLFKIGKESYTRFGPAVVEMVHNYGANVFLDLKYHDVTDTVKGAADAASKLGVYMFDVHASGGEDMLKAAVEGANIGAQKYGTIVPKVIGVTVLTSIDRNILNYQLKVPGSVKDQVLNLAQLCNTSGLDGIVCSAAYLYAIKDKLPDNFIYVTPGIKGPNTPAATYHKTVFTPGQAIEEGSSIIVIGTAITGPKKPKARIQAGYEVLQDIARYL